MTHVWVLRVCDCNNWLVSRAGSNSLVCGSLEPVIYCLTVFKFFIKLFLICKSALPNFSLKLHCCSDILNLLKKKKKDQEILYVFKI